MKNEFKLLKNGKNAETVWANPTTKEITIADRNSFGYFKIAGRDQDFEKKYGCNMRKNQGKSNYRQFSYSQNQMQEIGFQLVMRGSSKLW